MKTTRRKILTSALLLSAGFLSHSHVSAQTPNKDIPDFTRGVKIPEGSTHDWNLGPTGARGWIYSSKLETTEARQIYITTIEEGPSLLSSRARPAFASRNWTEPSRKAHG